MATIPPSLPPSLLQVPLTQLGPDPALTVGRILYEYKIHNCEMLLREDVNTDEVIDVIEGNR